MVLGMYSAARLAGTRDYLKKLYYTSGFEDIAIATALQCQGKFETVMNRLQARWAESKTALPLLFATDTNLLRDCLQHIFTCPTGVVQQTLRKLTARATARSEWVVLSHDATFKILFSILGQKKMSQASGEAHTAHTFIGMTGACPGFVLKANEGPGSFGEALQVLFTQEMMEQVRFLFSDSPHEDMLKYSPRAVGCAEDFLHLVLRLESCTGERRTPCTREVLALQQKFRAPAVGEGSALRRMIYHGEEGVNVAWDRTPAAAISVTVSRGATLRWQ